MATDNLTADGAMHWVDLKLPRFLRMIRAYSIVWICVFHKKVGPLYTFLNKWCTFRIWTFSITFKYSFIKFHITGYVKSKDFLKPHAETFCRKHSCIQTIQILCLDFGTYPFIHISFNQVMKFSVQTDQSISQTLKKIEYIRQNSRCQKINTKT